MTGSEDDAAWEGEARADVRESEAAKRMTAYMMLGASLPECCPGAGTMAHVRGCINHPEAER